MLKMKAKQLWEARHAWQQFSQTKKPVRISYLSGKFLDLHYYPELRPIQKAHDDLVKEHGEPSGNGFKIEPGTAAAAAFSAALEPILAEDVALEPVQIKFSEMLAILEKVDGLLVEDGALINIEPFFLAE